MALFRSTLLNLRSRTAPRAAGSLPAMVLSACAALLLQGCSIIHWALSDSEDAQATSQAQPQAAAEPDRASPAAAAPSPSGSSQGEASAPPQEAASPARSFAVPQEAAVAPAPVMMPSPAAPPAQSREPNATAAADARVPAAAPQASAAPGRAMGGRPPANGAVPVMGHYAVQVGAFRVEASANSVRDQVAAKMSQAASFATAQSSVRVVPRGGLFHVLVGDAADVKSANLLAARIREATQQDTFVTRP